MDILLVSFQSGLASLASYLAAHVLLCWCRRFSLPAPCRRWCRSSPSSVSSGRMPRSGFPIRQRPGPGVCSRSVPAPSSRCLPASTKRGRGWGRPSPFLFFAPAANILALSYTGVALGADFAIARIVLALSFGIGIGMIMAASFRRVKRRGRLPTRPFPAARAFPGQDVLIFLGGADRAADCRHVETGFPAKPFYGQRLRLPWRRRCRQAQLLDRWVPVNEATGAEG
jgi:hypothetical protein